MKPLKYFSLIICFLLLGCETIIECIINKSPEIPDKSFEVGNISYYYYQELTSEIKNEPNDDNYDYFYNIEGDLPDGLEMNSNFRTLYIEGTPIASGSFTFTIRLNVDPPEYYDVETQEHENSMCTTSTSKEFTIIIN